MNTSFELSPYLPQLWYIALGVLALLVTVLALARKMRDFLWRTLFLLVLAAALLNPIVLKELRSGLNDKLVIVLDDSPSQRIGGRDKIAEEALAHITAQVAKMPGVEPVIVRASADADTAKGESTNLFGALRNTLMSLPAAQVSGTIFITDGQVHDVPAELGALERMAPFHAVLTGKKKEFDRKVTVVSAPKYGVLNESITISVKVEDFGGGAGEVLPMSVFEDGQKSQELSVATGETRNFTFKLTHPGQNVFEFSVPAAEGELTAGNNNAPVIVNGIRDRMRVLLVSGTPHMGERAWRNLLKSDPSIDLVHFTILRAPTTTDFTPQYELSLIPFPVDELFSQKIKEFDLIIFDRYQNYDMLMMPHYFDNIASFVRNGGAFLMALGTADKAPLQSFSTLKDIMPVYTPATQLNIMQRAYRPQLTEIGKRHPVTADLGKAAGRKPWGLWFTGVETARVRGDTLMTGIDDKALLVLDKVGKGRVAMLTSDNIWLWSKGLAQAGPYTELLRNTAHWLMKEPELEDDFIKAEASGDRITVSQRDLVPGEKSVAMTKPSGKQEVIKLEKPVPGWVTAEVKADETGIYTFDNGVKKAFAVVGSATNDEFADVHTTADKIGPVVEKTKGGIVWYQENRGFSLKEVDARAGKLGDDDWIGVKRNKAYTVENVTTFSLMPNWLCLFVIFGGIVFAWWRESGAR
ncbi:MAG: hypothetical protein ACAH80_08135 [Alphaproteobacteria bacterium]